MLKRDIQRFTQMATEAVEMREEPAPRLPRAPRRRLLIVDDRELTCKQLLQILQSDSLEVEYRTDGSQALQALQDSVYSILLTDLMMPGMSGMDLIREVQKRSMPITIIVIAGHGSIGDAVEAIRLGAYDFLTK